MTEVKERLQAFLRGTTDIITLLSENGIIQYHSPAVETVLGYEQSDLVGDPVFNYVHPEDREETIESFTSSISGSEGGITKVEFRMRHADGHWVWVESQMQTADKQLPNGYVITSRDISERKENEQQLRQERERFSALFENFPEPTLSYAYEDDSPTFRQSTLPSRRHLGTMRRQPSDGRSTI
ncbi:PAS domain-containing protein [Halovenus salina]|uniref:histidine kinase n=1 Tax=Halovenus salina TaxID=1510225 RepID=A0ABD5W4A2_9EURY